MTASPEPSIVGWLNAQSASDLYLTTISLAEMQVGLQIVADPPSRKGR
jgi:hypothetical protein